MDYRSFYSTPGTRSPSRSPIYTSTSSSEYPQISETRGISYFSTLADTEKPYISPYTQDYDLPGRRPSGLSQYLEPRSASRFSTTSPRTSIGASMSTNFSSAQAHSTYIATASMQNTSSLGMSTPSTLSAVSHALIICQLLHTLHLKY